MDPELIAFLKAEFGAINARLDGHDARFESIDSRFKSIDGQFKSMQDQMDSRFDKVEEQNRHTHVLIEDLQSDVQLLAEGHGAQDESPWTTECLPFEAGLRSSKPPMRASASEPKHRWKIDRRFDEAETGRKEDRGHLEAMMKATFLQLSRRDDELEERTELVLRSAPE